jgi:nucleotide-binding universal stress UspA family protein
VWPFGSSIAFSHFETVGLRHRSRVGKFLLGSSAQRILLEADCPVLTVKSEPAGRRSG